MQAMAGKKEQLINLEKQRRIVVSAAGSTTQSTSIGQREGEMGTLGAN